jgi:O-antigen/teichoic acid export membrane protein
MQLDVIMLGLYVGRLPGVTLETVGVYAAAVAIGSGVRKVNQAFTPILTPVVARHLATGDVRGAETSYAFLARWMLALLLPLVAVLGLAGGAILTIYGPSFAQGGVWVSVIGAACALNAFAGLGELVLMVSRPAVNLANSCVALAAAIGLNLILIPAYGPLGAAIGMLVPYALQAVLRGVEMSWLLGWRWPWRELAKPWTAALLALPLGLGVRLLGGGTAAVQLAAASVYLAAYVAAWRAVGLEPKDREVLDLLLRRRPPAPQVVQAAS